MTDDSAAAVVLAAGKGTRMKSALPKVLHPLAGQPMIAHVAANLVPLACDPVVVVVAPGMAAVERAVAPWPTVVQAEQLGSGHAVMAARDRLADAAGDVLVVYGDSPFVSTESLRRLLARRRGPGRPAVVVLGMRLEDPGEYGRLILGTDGGLDAIVEYRDADADQRSINLCNSGAMAIDGSRLFDLLDRVGNANAKGEYYLTEIVAVARREGLSCAVVEAPADELLGVNSRADLAVAEAALQERLRARAMADGATLVDPRTVYFAHDTRLGRDVTVGPNVVFGHGVVVGDNVEIRPFCHIEGARIEAGAVIGPFARLRPGCEIGAGARIGNFVEAKNARLAAGAKANHLAYLGDASVGERANIGAGTITCNYDGFDKARTEIGADAFIGSNSALIAPVTIGERAIVGAGSVITRDVAPDALALARGEQVEKRGWAARLRQLKAERKKAPGKAEG
ncbi:MAG TPA: bifunctional UDP-N-acetylglucosamine diphosphorylase/glucosamine-1-phosphate N-acetyltransferase GlmU [Dongiaceae bacterium]|nr:bifunctional UDP-N-acetylglucosamine diphosphorylase/glucosamine-1-phosphate N-acetyltransferase GlmU [Dongiaceae bacterium]